MQYYDPDPLIIDCDEIKVTTHRHFDNSLPEGEYLTVAFEWDGSSPYTILPFNGIQQALNAGYYNVEIPVSHTDDLLPGMTIIIGDFLLELMAIESRDNGRYFNGIFERIAPPMS